MTHEPTHSPATPVPDAAEAAPAYQAPRVVSLGRTRETIRGYWQQGQADYGYNWYITGE